MFSTSRYCRSYLLSSESSMAFRPLPSDNSVGIVAKICDGRRRNQISTPGNDRFFFYLRRVQTGRGAFPTSRCWTPPFPRVKLSRRDADHSSASTVKIKNICRYALTPFMGWRLIMHSDGDDCICTFPQSQREEI